MCILDSVTDNTMPSHYYISCEDFQYVTHSLTSEAAKMPVH